MKLESIADREAEGGVWDSVQTAPWPTTPLLQRPGKIINPPNLLYLSGVPVKVTYSNAYLNLLSFQPSSYK